MACFLVEDPGIALVDLVGVEPSQVLYPWEFGKLWLGDPAEGKEEGAEPDLLDVGLMGVLGYYLLDRELSSALDVLAQPDQAEPSSP